MVDERAFQLGLERAAIGSVLGGGGRAPQRGTQRDLGGLLAHQAFHVARELLIEAERLVEVRTDVGDEELGGRRAHGALCQPDRSQQRDERGHTIASAKRRQMRPEAAT